MVYFFRTLLSAKTLACKALLTAIASLVLIAQVHAQESQDDKGIRISSGEEPALELTLSAGSPQYTVGEPMQFKVAANRAFYLYLFSEDLDSGELALLFPNQVQNDNYIPAGEVASLPADPLTFVRDTAGRERITAVGLLEPVTLEAPEIVYKGDFLNGEGGWLQAAFEDKGIRIREPDVQPDRSVQTIEVAVVADQDPLVFEDSDNADDPDVVVFVSAQCEFCKVGDPMRIVFGADRPGFVSLVVFDPEGFAATLVTQEVDGETIQSVTAVAEAPLGEHMLVAMYFEDADTAEGLAGKSGQFASSLSKGLSLEAAEQSYTPPHALFHFEILAGD